MNMKYEIIDNSNETKSSFFKKNQLKTHRKQRNKNPQDWQG